MQTLAFGALACETILQSLRKRRSIAHESNNSSNTRQRIQNACKCGNIFLPPSLRWNASFCCGLILVFLDSKISKTFANESSSMCKKASTKSSQIAIRMFAIMWPKKLLNDSQKHRITAYNASKLNFKIIQKCIRFTLRFKISNKLLFIAIEIEIKQMSLKQTN